MIRAYDDNGNVVDLVEWEKKIRADAIDEFVERITLPLTEEDIERIAKELKEQKNDNN